MSQYRAYPAYKDSGIEWIGQVPEHWQVKRLKHLISQCQNGVWGDDPLEDGSDTLCIRVADFDRDNNVVIYNPSTYRQITKEHQDSRLVSKGDILLEKSGGGAQTLVGANVRYLGEEPAVCSNFVAVIKPSKMAESAWLNYLMASMYALKINLRSIKQSTGIQNLDSEQYLDEGVAAPSLDEQATIAAALDRETARIDALIAKKTRFIELLKEKRHTLIYHAVTKGLDPDAPMRDSGVEWLGEIPAHWHVAQLGKVSIERCDGPFGSGLKSEHYQADGVRVIRLQNIGWASFKDGNEAFISHEHWQEVLGCGHEVLPNDVLIGGLGDDKNPLGRACVAPSNLGPAMVKADCYRFRLNTSRANPNFIALALSATARAECGYLATGATRDRLNLGLASARVVPLPPLNEQAEIVVALNRDTARIDLLTEKTQRSIDLLKERRAAFITAAVTGQIDLRESA